MIRMIPRYGSNLNLEHEQVNGSPNSHAINEPALILATQRGCLDSFNQLVLAYQNSLYATAYYILGDNDLAADAAQDAFLSAFRNINTYHAGSFKAWLTRIVANASYDELRRQKRRPVISIEFANDVMDRDDSAYWLVDSGKSIEELYDLIEFKEGVESCLRALPDHFRTVVVLVDIQGMNYQEAAIIESVPLGTIKSRLARARLRIRNDLEEFRSISTGGY